MVTYVEVIGSLLWVDNTSHGTRSKSGVLLRFGVNDYSCVEKVTTLAIILVQIKVRNNGH